MNDNIDISWIDNECLYPKVSFSSAVYNDEGMLSVSKYLNDCLSVRDNRNKGGDNSDMFSGTMRDIVAYIIDNILNAKSDTDFIRYYNLIMPSDHEKKILKSCYGVLMVLRNWETHHIYSSTNSNNDYSYTNKTSDGKEEHFFIHIPPKGIMLLKEILTTIIDHSCGISTQGHYLDFLLFHYNMLHTYIKTYGQYVSTKTELFDIDATAKLKWQRRCLVLNPSTEFINERIRIKNSISKNDSLDFLVIVEGEKYIIPQEVLHDNGI